MRLAGINPGNKTIVDKSMPPVTRHIVVAIVNTELAIQRLRWIGSAYELR